MTVTWSDFLGRLYLALDDDNRDNPTWTDAELRVYMDYALIGISKHTAQTKEYTYSVATSGLKTLALPADYLALGPVRYTVNGTERLLAPQRREPGQTYYDLAAAGSPETFYEWPVGKRLNFHRPLEVGAVVALDYYGYWAMTTNSQTQALELAVPPWMEEALQWAVLAKAMSKPGLTTAQIGPWKSRRDSGDPEDNPALLYARYCIRQYETILANQPDQDRTGWESN